MQDSRSRTAARVAALAAWLLIVSSLSFAQYTVTYLTANQVGKAANKDAHLVNAWGLARGASSPFWVSDQVTGLSTLYTKDGTPQSLVVTIPPASGTGKGSPTGIVFNGNNAFVVSKDGKSGPAFFIFATLDGTISGWNPGVDLNQAVVAVDNSSSGTVYTGLAIASDINWLYAADSANNRVNVYDENFNHIETLTDPTIPQGFTPYGIQVIGHEVYVTFASPNNAPGGFVDIFGEFGDFKRRFASGGTLNQPWGMAVAPANFGPFSNAILISNNLPNGSVNAFNRTSGKFLGQLKTPAGTVLEINQLWGLDFGGGNAVNGAKNQLFFTAGPQNYRNGRFGVIQFAP